MTTVGLLVCGAFSDKIMKKHAGAYEDFFIRDLSAADPTLSFKVYRVFEGHFPEHERECDAWLVTGSASGVYEDLPWIAPLFDLIRRIYKDGMPLVGICFGHQALAQALGGHVQKSTQGWGLGVQCYQMTRELPGIEEDRLNLHAIHQDQVVDIPPQAKVIAYNDHCPVAGLRYRGRAVSLQPHPEFTSDFERDLIDSLAGERFSEEMARNATSDLGKAKVHSREVMVLLAAFLCGQNNI